MDERLDFPAQVPGAGRSHAPVSRSLTRHEKTLSISAFRDF
jgi:hypothetical protein